MHGVVVGVQKEMVMQQLQQMTVNMVVVVVVLVMVIAGVQQLQYKVIKGVTDQV